MKILFGCPRYLPDVGGIEIGTHSLAKQLVKSGHDVSVVCQNYEGGKSYEVIEKVKVYRYPAARFHPIFRIWSFDIQQKNVKKYLKEFFLEHKFDLIIPRFFFYINPIRELLPKIKIIYVQPSIVYLALKKTMYNTKSIFDKLILFFRYRKTFSMEKKALILADIICSRSNAMDRINAEMFNIPKDKMFRYTQSTNLRKYKQKNLAKLRLQLGVGKTKNIIVVSRLTPDKNNLGLIKMFSKLKLLDVRLIIVGDGRERGVLKREVKKIGVKDKVLFLWEKKNPEEYYNLGDIFVLASKQEGFGIAFIEALSCGLPIIEFKSDYPGNITAVEDIIGDSRCGFAVRDEDEMIKKIEKILSNKKLLIEMSKNAIKRAGDYSEKKVVKKFLSELID